MTPTEAAGPWDTRWESVATRGSPSQAVEAEAEAARAGAADWVGCFRARRAIFVRETSPLGLPTPEAQRGTTRAAVLARAFAVRASLLALDHERARVWAAGATTTQPLDALSRAWLSVAARAGLSDVVREAQEVEREARAARDALAVVDAATVAAFATIEQGDATSGLALARRASRMAAAEGIGPLTVLSHLVLARARRVSGRPHLAAHIASVIAPYLSAPCSEWVAWERMLGAGPVASPGSLGPAGVLGSALDAAAGARRGDWDRATRDLDAPEVPHFAVADATTLREIVDHRVVPSTTSAWASGECDPVPLGVDGASGEAEGRCYVLARPEHPGRRISAAGVALARAEVGATLVASVADQARTDSAVSALLLAGPSGVDTAVLFQRLYGFALVERHRGVLRVLLHRVRARTEGWATLEHERGRARLVLAVAVLFPDPRCERPDADVLAIAAHRGALVAKDLADAMGIPLRRAQDALKRLTDAGLFRAVVEGRATSYVLEDTTFGEPTPLA